MSKLLSNEFLQAYDKFHRIANEQTIGIDDDPSPIEIFGIPYTVARLPISDRPILTRMGCPELSIDSHQEFVPERLWGDYFLGPPEKSASPFYNPKAKTLTISEYLRISNMNPKIIEHLSEMMNYQSPNDIMGVLVFVHALTIERMGDGKTSAAIRTFSLFARFKHAMSQTELSSVRTSVALTRSMDKLRTITLGVLKKKATVPGGFAGRVPDSEKAFAMYDESSILMYAQKASSPYYENHFATQPNAWQERGLVRQITAKDMRDYMNGG